MSLKENVDYIKEELSSQEKFLESSLKAEKFYKKYKYIIFGTIGGLITLFIVMSIMEYSANKTKKEANILYQNILEGSKDTNEITKLKELNRKLYEIAIYKTDQSKEAISVEYLSELQAYEKAIASKDINALNKLIASQSFLLKDFALINKAILQIENKEYKKAKNTLKSIDKESQAQSLVGILQHFLITK